jgi:hypothetical protein
MLDNKRSGSVAEVVTNILATTGAKLYCIWSDNGKELNDQLRRRGIRVMVTQAYNSEQNWKMERWWRTGDGRKDLYDLRRVVWA